MSIPSANDASTASPTPQGSGWTTAPPKGRSSLVASGEKTRGCSSSVASRANATTGQSGASTPGTNGRLMTSTSTPATAESPASSRIVASTTELLSTPARRTATTRAAGVQTPPGMYLASIESISAPSASP